jgi:pimeloyl-ACP methyl ester carboxylesterase
MELAVFRRRFRPRRIVADGLAWRVIDVKARPGAPALLMLPGTLGTAEIWWNQIVALKGRARLVAVTYPQCGDIERLADSLSVLARRLGVARASVVGSSLGGYLAQILAARHPALIDTLFIGNSLSDPTGPHPSNMTAAALARAPGAFHRDMVLGSVSGWPEPSAAHRRLKALLVESGTRRISARALKARVLAVRAGPVVPKLAVSDRRVVIVDCADDPLLPRAVQDDVRRRYPRARAYRLRFGGHYPYVMDPAAYTAILARHMGLGARRR